MFRTWRYPRRQLLIWPWLILASTVSLGGCGILLDSGLTISWTTENELDTVGFNVYRSQTREGPFVRINKELLPPSNDPNVGGDHTFVDYNVIGGATYYYQLEIVDRQGRATRTETLAVTVGG